MKKSSALSLVFTNGQHSAEPRGDETSAGSLVIVAEHRGRPHYLCLPYVTRSSFPVLRPGTAVGLYPPHLVCLRLHSHSAYWAARSLAEGAGLPRATKDPPPTDPTPWRSRGISRLPGGDCV